MIQVLERATRILEYLSSERGRDIPLSEISEALGIHKATCANILKSMKDLGLVFQVDYRSGYNIGDKIYSFAGLPSGHSDKALIRTMKPIMDNLCKEINENLMLTVIRGNKRVLIYKALGKNDIEAKVIDVMEPWPATTARVVLAHYDRAKLNTFIKSVGMPGDTWDGIVDRDELDARLKTIRESRHITVINHHFACIAAPVFDKGEVIASLGCYLPDIRLSNGRRENIEKRIVEESVKASLIISQ